MYDKKTVPSDEDPLDEDTLVIREVAPLIPATRRGEATRQRIIEAAEQVFGDLGFYEASVAEITRQAGVAQGTFYLYFHSKREIFLELMDNMGRQLRQVTSRAIVGAKTRLEAEQQGFKAFFLYIATHRQMYHIVQECERIDPRAAQAYYKRINDGYQRGLLKATETGEIRVADSETIGYALMGIAHFLALRWLVWPESNASDMVPDHVIDAAFTFIAYGLQGDPTPSVP